MNGSPRISSRGAKRRYLLVVGAGILFIVAALLGAVSYQRTPKELIAIADQLQPDASWQLVSERVEPERLLCIGDVACPSAHLRWTTSTQPSMGGFVKMAEQTGVDPSRINAQTGDCALIKNLDESPVNNCSVRAQVDGYYVSLYLSKASPDQVNWSLSLSVREE